MTLFENKIVPKIKIKQVIKNIIFFLLKNNKETKPKNKIFKIKAALSPLKRIKIGINIIKNIFDILIHFI